MSNNLKKIKFGSMIGALCVALILISCDNTDDSNLNQSELDEMRNEIVALSVSLDCTNASDWSFIEIGNKPCGGPAGYIAYSKQIDTTAFLVKVLNYNNAHRNYNMKNGIVSDCSIEQRPVGVKCQEEGAVLIYNPCELIPDAGLCNAAIPKYYFDQETQECKEFIWGGCNGVVPFDTLVACQDCE